MTGHSRRRAANAWSCTAEMNAMILQANAVRAKEDESSPDASTDASKD